MIYARNINLRLYLLWLACLVVFASCIYLTLSGFVTAAFAAALLLIALGFVPVRRLIIVNDTIVIDKYYGYGFLQNRVVIDKASGLKAELFVNDDVDADPDAETPLSWIIFLLPFLYKKYALWVSTPEGKTRIILKLSKKEYELLNEDRQYKKILPLA